MGEKISMDYQVERRGAWSAAPAADWPDRHALAALYECNERALDLLQAHARAVRQDDLFARELKPLLLQLDVASKARAARCAVLLVDPGFGDAGRWARAIDGVIPAQEYAAPYFNVTGTVEAARVILTCAAHLAYSDAGSARLLFGLAPGCIEAFTACTVTRIVQLADSHWSWFRPRWCNRPRYWRDLLVTAMNGTPAAQARMRVRGLQLLAGDARPG